MTRNVRRFSATVCVRVCSIDSSIFLADSSITARSRRSVFVSPFLQPHFVFSHRVLAYPLAASHPHLCLQLLQASLQRLSPLAQGVDRLLQSKCIPTNNA